MRRFVQRSLVTLALLGTLAPAARAQTVEDVVRKYLEARGGLARLRSVQSLRLSGTVELPGMPAAPFSLELKRPAKMRTTVLIEGRASVRAFDGQGGWTQPPVPGEPARVMGEEDAAEARAQADVDLSPLVDATAKGYAVELVGRDRVPEGETFKLLVRGGGQFPERTLQVDVHSHLVVRTEERRSVEGRGVDFVTEIGDYRVEAGLAFPHRMEVGPRGSADRQRVLIRTVEVNPALDASRFAMPGGVQAAQPPAPGGLLQQRAVLP